MGTRIRLLLGIFMLMGSSVFAQRALHTLQQADKAYDRLQFDAAIKLYEKYYATDSGNNKVILRLADAYWNVRDYNKSFTWYNMASADTIQANNALGRRLAELNAMKGNYDYAAEKLNAISGFQERAEGFKYKDEFLKDSADWNLGYLNINTRTFREFSPLIFRDKFIWSTNELVTKSKKGVMGWDANGYIRQVYLTDLAQLESTDFPGPDTVQTVIDSTIKKIARHYAGADVSLAIPKATFAPAKRKDSVLQRFPELKGLEGVYYNVAHATGSSETGKIYLSANRQEKLRSNATRGLGIVEGEVEGDYITNTKFLPLVQNDPSTAEDVVMHGAIDPTGQYLIYSSNQLGGKGGYDLYMVKKMEDQSWSTPVAVTELNTPGNEVFSSFAPTGDLFFSSDGHPGLGGLDIYRVGFERGIITSDVEHLSFPVNSSADDFGMIFTDNGRVGFFTTDRYGSDDIIAFDYKRKYTPMKGAVVEQGTNLKRPNIPVYLYQKDRKGVQVLIDSAITNSEGVYNFSYGRPNRNYVVYVHEPRVENVAPRMIALDVLVPPSTNPLDLPLVTISQGKGKPPVFAKAPSTLVDSNYLKYGRLGIDTSWLVKHDPHAHQKVVLDSVYFIIYFDFDKYALKQESVNTLNRATNYLKSNPNNGFILLGHTDLRGNPTYNINLSRNRVSAAKKYMTSKGIEPRRLELEYFGQKFPVKRALTPEAGKLNRRVEFILIKK